MEISNSGYIKVLDILNHKSFKNLYSVDDILRIVKTNDKQRFTIIHDKDTDLQICANQGHSIQVSTEIFEVLIHWLLSCLQNVDVELKPVALDEEIEVIHGTSFKNWEKIKTEGLSRMKRNHIHFATGRPTDRNVISGVRNNAQIFIYINLWLAISEGLKFYRSINNVILSTGDENGIIKPKYFFKVCGNKGNILNLN